MFAIDSIDKIINISVCIDSFNSIKISVWIDSFNSINISGSKLKPSSSISFDLFSGIKFSIKSAESAGCNSFSVLFRNYVLLASIFLLKTLMNSLLNSKFTFLSFICFVKLINVIYLIIFRLFSRFFLKPQT